MANTSEKPASRASARNADKPSSKSAAAADKPASKVKALSPDAAAAKPKSAAKKNTSSTAAAAAATKPAKSEQPTYLAMIQVRSPSPGGRAAQNKQTSRTRRRHTYATMRETQGSLPWLCVLYTSLNALQDAIAKSGERATGLSRQGIKKSVQLPVLSLPQDLRLPELGFFSGSQQKEREGMSKSS